MFNGTWTHEKLPPETARQTAAVSVSPQILNAYVGEYEITPNQIVTITLENGKLMGVMTGQPKVELSPVSETKFIVKEVDAEVNFFKDTQGQVTHLILRLNGEEMRGRKIKIINRRINLKTRLTSHCTEARNSYFLKNVVF